MQVEKKLLCRWDLVRFLTSHHLLKIDGTKLTLSVTNGSKGEFMIFLGKDDSDSGYEVRIYKANPDEKYFQLAFDNVSRFEENEEYVTFFFGTFENAQSFIEVVMSHPEFQNRPVRQIA